MDIAPTRERLARSEYEPPVRDQQRSRAAYRVLNPFEALVMRGDLEPELGLAADELERHWYGALRHDVRMTSVYTQEFADLGNAAAGVNEFPWVRHGQEIARAKSALMPSEWLALMDFMEERATLQDIGRSRRMVKNNDMARSQGLMVISTALERLAYLWGIKQRPSDK